MSTSRGSDPLELFHPAVAGWFRGAFGKPTSPQELGWPAIARGESTLILAPTGSGKTLAAFLWALDRVMFGARAVPEATGCRVLYVSPLKALAVDIERNLRAPLAGIVNAAAASGETLAPPRVAVRTGDTPAAERARMAREPADILITTPESLFLLLTSQARETLRGVETVIVDEIHALVPTKRGAHLALSLERLDHLRGGPVQRIGLSATQRPLDEVARFLGGAEPRRRSASAARARAADVDELLHDEFAGPGKPASWRPVTIVDTGERKALELRVEVPVEDLARLGESAEIRSGPAVQATGGVSIWSAIHPRLLDLIREHRSTLIFANSRRLAERLAGALNELAGETLVRAHHGSVARAQRLEIEDQLKAGTLRALVATSSLELGIDMGAIDLVVQIEAPPSVASGLQRIGRAAHRAGESSRGVIFPKFRGDLVSCAAVTRAMRDGHVEATRFPRNPLDVLAQQLVAMVAMDDWEVEALYAAARRAAPYADLGRSAFDGVLDMLAGRFPSDDFADLRPRITWDRVSGQLSAREGAKRVAVTNAGTIPDRGLYGVYLAGAGPGAARVGELDEEMVFESRPGETFLLGASTWRIEEITHDRVLVSPAPGEPGKMPFWRGDAVGRPLEFGRAIGALVRGLRGAKRGAALDRLVREHDLDARAADNLLRYLDDQAEAAAGVVPDDRTVLIERVRDELGDWRVCVLSPFGGRIHTPWAMAVAERLQIERGARPEMMWTDDGFVARFPDSEEPPDSSWMLPDPDEAESLVVRQLGATSLFAARFREAAGRALLLPRRNPARRSPLWQKRKRAHDLMSVAAQFGSFPILLETYRECLRDVFDMPALVETLRGLRTGAIHAATVDSTAPSPFCASLLFGYVANAIYEGDAPLAERRAQALAIDHAQLRELLGEAELRELLDADVLDETERRLQLRESRHRARSLDGLHDLLLRLGDLGPDEVAERVEGLDPAAALGELAAARRALRLRIGGAERWVPVEYAARYRDALGAPLPQGLPATLLAPVPRALEDVARRFARTRGPFDTRAFAERYGLAEAVAAGALAALAAAGKVVEGEFRPGGRGREWCDSEVLRTIRQRSLAKVRKQVEPVEPAVLGRAVARWHGVTRPRAGLDALLDAIEKLQGAALPASVLDRAILPARVTGYRGADLDTLAAAGEIVWAGIEPIGEKDGRIALFLTDHLPRLWTPREESGVDAKEQAILEFLRRAGASFFGVIHAAAGGGFPDDTVRALWDLVWKGLVTNDSFAPLRAFLGRHRSGGKRRRGIPAAAFQSRRAAPPAAAGRWSLVASRAGAFANPTERAAALATQLLQRYGLITREVAAAEAVAGGFSAIYGALKLMEEGGRIRRGYFVSGVAATQFALPAALDLLRSLRDEPEPPDVVTLAASDPANPYGTLLEWPWKRGDAALAATRAAGALVILVNGRAAAWLGRGRQLLVQAPEEEPQRTIALRAVAAQLATLATETFARTGLMVAEIDGQPASDHPIAPFLMEAGFALSPSGYQFRQRTAARLADA